MPFDTNERAGRATQLGALGGKYMALAAMLTSTAIPSTQILAQADKLADEAEEMLTRLTEDLAD